jgi:hypothetical protein
MSQTSTEKEKEKQVDKRANIKAKILIAKDLGATDDQLKDMDSIELDEAITYLKTKKNTSPAFIDPSKNVGSPPGIPDPQDPATITPESISEEERHNAAFNPRHPSKGRRWNEDACLLILFDEDGIPILI